MAWILKSDFLLYKNTELEDKRVKEVKQFPMFRTMKDKELRNLIFDEKIYTLNAVVYNPGDDIDGIYLVVEG